MTEVSEVLSCLTEEHGRLGRAIEKNRRELREFSQSCRGPLDSMDRAGLCSCQLEIQAEFDRLSKLHKRYAEAVDHVHYEGAVCAECGEDISERIMKVPSTLCYDCATEVEIREIHERRTVRWQPALV
jgi:RNA polymerase-binding transcription factor DksA